MNSKKKKMFVVALVAAAILAACSGEAQADYRTYVIRPAINNDPILEGEALPAECRDETVMKVMCARGEYEPASFLVETDKPLEQVMVEVGPLTGSAGVLGSETVDVRIAQKFRVRPCFGDEAIPWVLVHDPGMMKVVNKTPKWVLKVKEKMIGTPTDKYPLAEYQASFSKVNVLLKPLIDTDQLQPGDIEDFRQFWLTVHVPDDAPSGTYRAPVTISAKNAPASKLTLEVTVPSFDLLAPKFEYSIYYPAMLQSKDMPKDLIARYNPLTEQQYLAELRNMVAHGCTNPNIYVGVGKKPDGTLDYSRIERILALREKAGIGPGLPLYMMSNAGEPVPRSLTEEEKKQITREVREVMAWGKKRGYPDIYWTAGDEFSGERLRSQRDSFQAIHEGGGKIWVACFNDFFDIVGDLLDCPVLQHPGARIVDQHQQWGSYSRDWFLHRQRMVTWSPELLLTPHIQKMIKGVHKNGFKIFLYMDPQAGYHVPEEHRRNRGLGMWKTGIDGTMTWAYIGIWAKTTRFDPLIKDNFVGALRGPQGPLDTLAWEGYREGYDDARYLATLQDAIAKAKAAGKHARLVARTERWLGDLTVDADLDAWRLEMARRTEALLKP